VHHLYRRPAMLESALATLLRKAQLKASPNITALDAEQVRQERVKVPSEQLEAHITAQRQEAAESRRFTLTMVCARPAVLQHRACGAADRLGS